MNNAANQTRKTTVIDFISVSITSTQKVAFFPTRVSDTVDEGANDTLFLIEIQLAISKIYIYTYICFVGQAVNLIYTHFSAQRVAKQG